MSTLQEWILDIPAIRDEAKAIWGEEMIEETTINDDYVDEGFGELYEITREVCWKVRLREIVIADNPEQYYREHKPKQVEFSKEITKGATTIDLSSEPKESK